VKFSIANLMLAIALIAVAIGWWCDHRRLSEANGRLNAEAAELFTQHTMGSSISSINFPDGKLPPNRVYTFSDPEDRAAYAKTYWLNRIGTFPSSHWKCYEE
jgi:hypothetical protein